MVEKKDVEEKEVKKADEVKSPEDKGSKFNSKWLEGKKYHYAEKKMIEKNGRKTLHPIPMERPATEKDVLGWSIYGEKVVIALRDGQPKFSVKK